MSASELDGIIFQQLSDIGCKNINESTTFADIDSEVLIHCILKALNLISPGKFPLALPRAMSQRVGGCSDIANHIKDLGYRGDLGYHQLMYPNNVNDTRSILRFVVEQLPESESTNQEVELGM